jgi:ATP-dependent helicase/nuclease subunit A
MLDRTIFAVGDEKQSIFSFQGAVPREFDTMRKDFAKLCQAVDQELRYVPFRHSFRSGPNVLAAVDTVFARPQAFSGLSADNVGTVHESLPEARPGVVEIWDTTRPDQKRDIEAWDAPFDNVTETSAQARLAQRIAKNVARMTKQEARAGDVLILVRQRGALFEAIIRSLKDNHVAVAGADRLVLTEHIAVMDLMVLADALLLPDDDLALATVLKSPLFGFDDDDLFEIAWKRRGSLRAALRGGAGEDFAAAARELDKLADLARRESPFAFYAHVLGRRHGRQRMRARLGPEADDALDEFLNLALDYESREPPSLQGFVAWLRGANAEIKRDMEIARDEVRVMTVHGAKGLEAPIVILADTTTLPAGPPQRWPKLVTLPGAGAPGAPEPFVWAGAKATEAALVNTARDRVRGEAENEYRRLLYVGMTRAIDRLIVCGYDGERKRPQGCWYDLVFDALSTVAVVSEPANGTEGPIWRFGGDAPAAIGAPGPATATPTETPRPPWLDRDAVPEGRRLVPLSPSSAYDEATTVRAGGSLEPRKALARGSATHRLLQSLPDIPPEARQEAARRHMARVPELDAEERETVVDQALAILGDARFAELFQPGSRAEVPIVGRLTLQGHTVAVSGQVDRLVATADAVLIADYKTNRPAPTRIEDVPPAYVTQLALYRAVLARLYPDRVIRAALVWTDVPDLMEISADAMDHALARVTPA